ncbi:MAG: Panacea domain-containing protein [Bryobacteraceae bacterium]
MGRDEIQVHGIGSLRRFSRTVEHQRRKPPSPPIPKGPVSLIRMRFNEAKATQAAARLLRNRGGKMSYMKLIRLLYLADREALGQWGRTITADTYVSMDKGRVLSHVLDRINEGPSPEDPSFWAQHITPSGNYEVTLTIDPNGDLLSEAEDELLDKIFKDHGHLSRWKMVDLVHTLPEWQNPDGGAIPINYADILKAQMKDPDEIDAIVNELNNLARIDELCAPR